MKELELKDLPLGATGYISRCRSPFRTDVYRLLEMGMCRGARLTVLQNASVFGGVEIALQESRLCIANELASEFMVVLQSCSLSKLG